MNETFNTLHTMAAELAPFIEQVQKAYDELERENTRLEGLCERLKMEAQIHAGEDDTHKSIIYEIYQHLGIQKGDWNGAKPVIEKFSQMAAHAEQLRETLESILGMTTSSGTIICSPSVVKRALAKTPAQSLRHIEHRVEEETIRRCSDFVEECFAYDDIRQIAIELQAELQRKYPNQPVKEGER